MPKRILVIDDDEAIRKSFVLALEDMDYRVETTQSGEEGVNKVRTNEYSLIFLDLKMPGLNGADTLRELRKIDKDVPVYIVTAFHKEFFDQLKVAEEEGMYFEIAKKPLSADQIVVITKSILEEPQVLGMGE